MSKKFDGKKFIKTHDCFVMKFLDESITFVIANDMREKFHENLRVVTQVKSINDGKIYEVSNFSPYILKAEDKNIESISILDTYYHYDHRARKPLCKKHIIRKVSGHNNFETLEFAKIKSLMKAEKIINKKIAKDKKQAEKSQEKIRAFEEQIMTF